MRFNLEKVERLEAVAERFEMSVEYGAYPHLKESGDKEIAAVQDWTNATLIFIRPGYSTGRLNNWPILVAEPTINVCVCQSLEQLGSSYTMPMNRFGKQLLLWLVAGSSWGWAVGLVDAAAIPPTGVTLSTASPGYRDVQPRAIYKRLTRADRALMLINVHIPYEGQIQSTDAFIPFHTITKRLSALPADRDVEVVLYCMSGRMSEIAARRLVKRGYTNVKQLRGGMIAWQKAELPLKRQSR